MLVNRENSKQITNFDDGRRRTEDGTAISEHFDAMMMNHLTFVIQPFDTYYTYYIYFKSQTEMDKYANSEHRARMVQLVVWK